MAQVVGKELLFAEVHCPVGTAAQQYVVAEASPREVFVVAVDKLAERGIFCCFGVAEAQLSGEVQLHYVACASGAVVEEVVVSVADILWP